MFNCKESIHRLLDFLEGDLTPEEQAALREHFEGCSPCVEFLETYRATPKLCREHLVRKMPDQMAGKLTDFLRTKLSQK